MEAGPENCSTRQFPSRQSLPYQGSTAVKIPWEDLRYIFGEIMYGGVLSPEHRSIPSSRCPTSCAGHIVDDWDRRMCQKYLTYFMQDPLQDPLASPLLGRASVCRPSAVSAQEDEILDEMELVPYAGIQTAEALGFFFNLKCPCSSG